MMVSFFVRMVSDGHPTLAVNYVAMLTGLLLDARRPCLPTDSIPLTGSVLSLCDEVSLVFTIIDAYCRLSGFPYWVFFRMAPTFVICLRLNFFSLRGGNEGPEYHNTKKKDRRLSPGRSYRNEAPTIKLVFGKRIGNY